MDAVRDDGLRIAAAVLRCRRGVLEPLRTFYLETLGFQGGGGDGVALRIGDAIVRFVPGEAEAFYHYALLVPARRFEAARDWAAARADLLPGPGGETTFAFPAWNARAVYFHDPAGNIVELIAHDARADPAGAPFAAAELQAISEVGVVVGAPREAADLLDREAGLKLWSGDVEGANALGFVGRRAHTLIVVPPGRGWLPTGRPAEAHPVDAVIAGPGLRPREVAVEAHRVVTRPG